MRRSTAVTAIVSAAVAGLVLIWNTIDQDRAFRTHITDGDTALSTDDVSGAVAAFSGALALRPDSMLAHLKRGDAYLRRGELLAALADLTAATSLDRTATRPKELLGDVNAALARPRSAINAYRAYLTLDEQAPHILIKLGGEELRDGQTSAALVSARKALDLEAGLAEAHYLVGLALQQSDPVQAATAFGRAVALKPSLLSAREQLATVLLDTGRLREGVAVLEAVAALGPSEPARAAAVVCALAKAGKTDIALQRLDRADEQFPESRTLLATRGQILLDRAETDRDPRLLAEAEAILAPLANRATSPAFILAAMGRARMLAGDPRSALPWLQRASKELPVAAAALRLLARAATEAGEELLAMDALLRHEAVHPGSTFALAHARRIATFAALLGDFPKAIAWAEHAARGSSNKANDLVLLASAQCQAGQHEKCATTIQKGLATNPKHEGLLALSRSPG
jgi:tetratricopeptide (TPR) repeat protein